MTVAPDVLPRGTHTSVPPAPPDPMHWLTVTPAGVATGTLLVTVTLQITLLPPPVTMPLHWLTEVTSWVDVVTVVVGPPLVPISTQEGNGTPAALMHSLVVTVELVAPVDVVLFTTVTEQVTCSPAAAGRVAPGKSGGLHWMTEGAVTVAAGDSVAAGATAGALCPEATLGRTTHVNIESTVSTPTRTTPLFRADSQPMTAGGVGPDSNGLTRRTHPAGPARKEDCARTAVTMTKQRAWSTPSITPDSLLFFQPALRGCNPDAIPELTYQQLVPRRTMVTFRAWRAGVF